MQHGSARQTAGRWLRWPADGLRGTLAKSPVTLVFLVLFWFLGILTSSILDGPDDPLLPWVSVSVDTLPEYWPALLLSALWANGLAGYISGTLLTLAVGLPAERLLGSRRFLAAAVGTQVIGALAGIGFAATLRGAFENWGRELSTDSFLGPVALVCGIAAAASAGMGTLWRRRVRLALFTLLVVLALYSGSLRDVMALAAAVAGGLVGPYLFGRRPQWPQSLVSSRREARVLMGLLVVATAVGPVIAALNVRAVGPLAVLAYLFTNAETLDPVALATICADPGMQAECRTARLEQSAGAAGFFLAVLPQVLLIVFADGLRRGRRFAWISALILQGLMTLTAAVRIGYFLSRAAPAGSTASAGRCSRLRWSFPCCCRCSYSCCWPVSGRLFTVSAPPGTYRRLFLTCATAGVVLAAAWVGGGLLLRSGFTPQASLPALRGGPAAAFPAGLGTHLQSSGSCCPNPFPPSSSTRVWAWCSGFSPACCSCVRSSNLPTAATPWTPNAPGPARIQRRQHDGLDDAVERQLLLVLPHRQLLRGVPPGLRRRTDRRRSGGTAGGAPRLRGRFRCLLC